MIVHTYKDQNKQHPIYPRSFCRINQTTLKVISMEAILVVGNRNSSHYHRHLRPRTHHRRLTTKRLSCLVLPTLEKFEDRNASCSTCARTPCLVMTVLWYWYGQGEFRVYREPLKFAGAWTHVMNAAGMLKASIAMNTQTVLTAIIGKSNWCTAAHTTLQNKIEDSRWSIKYVNEMLNLNQND